MHSIIEKYADNFGNKSANLMVLSDVLKAPELQEINAEIPDFIPIAHTICFDHLNKHAPDWQKIWDKFIKSRQQNFGALSDKELKLLSELRTLIIDAFKEPHIHSLELEEYLNKFSPTDTLMVRSTGREDSQELANPGGNLSLASIQPNIQQISESIGEVIASYFSEKSLQQRLKGADDITSTPFMPVLIQKMIGETAATKADEEIVYSGVMYAESSGAIIQGAPGHGELIVSGSSPYDTHYVTNQDVVYKETSVKTHRMAPSAADGKLELRRNTKTKQTFSLPDSVVWRLNKIGREIEKEYNQPMDIEWVYEPTKNVIYIVQARPIPKGSLNASPPSSVKSERSKELKAFGNCIFGEVISPANRAAKIITSPDQILIVDDIDQALDIYLKMDNSSIKAVVVKQPSATNSHAAAQFNSVLIPVLRMSGKEISRLEEWIGSNQACIVVDPQRKQIFNATNFINKNISTTVEEQLFEPIGGLLANGLFKSHLPTQLTVTQPIYSERRLEAEVAPIKYQADVKIGELLHIIETGDRTEANTAFSTLMSIYFDLVKHKPTKNISSFAVLRDELDTIESATKNNIQDCRKSLQNIMHFFLKLSLKESENAEKPNELSTLLAQCMSICTELWQISRKLTLNDNSNHDIMQSEWLNMVNRLEAIIFNLGNTETLSHSLLQVLAEKKVLKQATTLKQYTEVDEVDQESRNFLIQFSKLTDYACNHTLKQQWLEFVAECVKEKQQQQKLAHIVHYFVTRGVPSLLINNVFSTVLFNSNAPDKHKETLDRMFKQCKDTIVNLNTVSFFIVSDTIDKWQRNVPKWSNKNDFNKYMENFNSDIDKVFTILDSVNLQSIGLLDKAFILKEINRLTEVIDTSIKSLKSSGEYSDDKALQASRFADMLRIYHRLMGMQISLIPDDVITQYRPNISNKYTHKDVILQEIKLAFEKNLRGLDETRLYPSKDFHVHSAIISSPACFERHFINRKDVTLEDLFTLFHQNILAANTYLGKDLDLSKKDTPQILLQIIEYFEQNTAFRQVGSDNSDYKYKASLMNSTYTYPNIELSYNLPLAYHGLQFTIKWNVKTHELTIESKMFGEARDRFDKISTFANAYTKLAGFSAPGEHCWFDKERSLLRSTYILPQGSSIKDILSACSMTLEAASMSFDTYPTDFALALKLASNKLPNPAEENKFKIMLNVCLGDRNFVSSLEHLKKLFKLVQENKFSQKLSIELLTIMLKSISTSAFSNEGGLKTYAAIQKHLHPESYMQILANAQIGKDSTYLELLIKSGLNKEALQLLDFTEPAKHSNLLKILVNRQPILDDDDILMAKKLISKRFASRLTEAEESKLFQHLPLALQQDYKALKISLPKETSQQGRQPATRTIPKWTPPIE